MLLSLEHSRIPMTYFSPLVAAALAVTAVVGLQKLTTGQAGPGEARAPRVAVLAELFTSEGCSSCPAADDLLRRLIADQPINGVEVIAISEHVDYWNRLGWRDPFSSPRFTERQTEYATTIASPNGVYTPQLVVDGRIGVVGSDLSEVRRALTEAASGERATVMISATQPANLSTTVRASVGTVPSVGRDGTIRVMVAIVEDNLVTDVTRGENASRRLKHDAVVRALHTIGSLDGDESAGEFSKKIELDRDWAARHLRVVAFLQDARTHRIVGVASAKLG